MTALLYSSADGYRDPQPLPIDAVVPELRVDGRRYVLEAWANRDLWGGYLFREVAA